MNPFKALLAGISAIAFIAALAVGGWQLGWWMQNSAANHNAVITQNGLAAQTADIQESRALVGEIYTINSQINSPATPKSEVASLQAQGAVETTQACALINTVTSTLPVDLVSFKSTNC